METDVQFYYSKGLVKSLYQSGKDYYTKFCIEANISPLPVSEQHLCLFVSFVAIKAPDHKMLSAICHLQISIHSHDGYLHLMTKVIWVPSSLVGGTIKINVI